MDSTAKAASVALAEEEKVLSYFVADNGLTHSEILLPMAEAVLEEAKTVWDEVDAYAVTVGPGSFTGVRIGVATVKGLADPCMGEPKANCIAVSTLEALAHNLAPLDGVYVAVMDAKRGEVYNALFRSENGELVRLCPDRAISLSALGEELVEKYGTETVRLAGDGYDVAMAALSALPLRIATTPPLLRIQNAASVAAVAAKVARRGEMLPPAALAPVYLRLPQAERDRLKKENQKDSI